MKAKHISTASHSELLQLLRKHVAESMQNYRYNIKFHLATKLLVYLGLSITSYYLLIRTQSSTALLMWYVIFGFVTLLFAFNFSHDFSHNTIFKNKWLNNFCFTAIYTLVGAHAEAWKHRHTHSHHFAPNVEGYDSDLQITSLIRVTPGSEYKSYHKLQAWYAPLLYTTYSLYWVLIKDMALLFRNVNIPTQFTLRYHFNFWLQKSIYIFLVLIVPYQLSGHSFSRIVLGFLVMHLTQSVFLLFTFFMTHHVESSEYPTTTEDGTIQTTWLANQIRSSNDMHPFSKTANFILGGFNNHIAHHLFPHIHHAYYPMINRTIYPILQKHGFTPNQTSYWGGIVSHLRHLSNLSTPHTKQ